MSAPTCTCTISTIGLTFFSKAVVRKCSSCKANCTQRVQYNCTPHVHGLLIVDWPQNELQTVAVQSYPCQRWLLWRVQWPTTVNSDHLPTVKITCSLASHNPNIHVHSHPRTQTCWLCLFQTQSLLPAKRRKMITVCLLYHLTNTMFPQRGYTFEPVTDLPHGKLSTCTCIWRIYTSSSLPHLWRVPQNAWQLQTPIDTGERTRGVCTCIHGYTVYMYIVHTSLAASRSHFLAELALVMVSRVVKVCREDGTYVIYIHSIVLTHQYHGCTCTCMWNLRWIRWICSSRVMVITQYCTVYMYSTTAIDHTPPVMGRAIYPLILHERNWDKIGTQTCPNLASVPFCNLFYQYTFEATTKSVFFGWRFSTVFARWVPSTLDT